ncbi:MAG: hypothetical protein PHN44_01660 [Candidatus Marinimicrobia bacterium]|nr:hypothetical protein [Candidatus Neomarinimicrobiota bacterium]
MYDFILQIFIMFSLGTVIFLVARALPRISETETANAPKSRTNWFSSFPFEKVDAAVNAFSEKTLRKIKLILMKTDNMVSRQLNKFKKDGDNGNAGNGLTK